MKKLLSVILMIITVLTFGGCSKDTFMDISAFTHYYNEAAGEKEIDLTDYLYRDGAYSLLFKKEKEEILLTLETDSEGKIDEIRLLIPKVDYNGNEKPITESGKELFTSKLRNILVAYTSFNASECEGIIAGMKLDMLSSFNSTGELTLTKGEWHFVYYGTEISSVFMIYNIHLHPTEKTQKPESKPAFGNTAYTREDRVRTT